jgi:hypothetical protein
MKYQADYYKKNYLKKHNISETIMKYRVFIETYDHELIDALKQLKRKKYTCSY